MTTAADKLLAALALFTLERPEWTVEDAAKELQLGVSTTYRYFKSLADAGLIVAFATGRYVLGPAITHLDRQTRLLDPLLTVAKPIMHGLVREVGTTGVLLLCRLYRHQVMCVHQESLDTAGIPVSYERGKLMPLHRGAASKIVLAYLPARFVRSFHQEHGSDMAAVGLGTSWDDVKRSLRKLRSAGVAVTRAELDPEVIGIAAPLFGSDGGIIGSLGLVIPDTNLKSPMTETVAERLKSTASSIDAAFAATIEGISRAM